MELEAGTVLANRYQVIRPLGRGGMGEVYAAQHIHTGRPVAVKLLRSDSKSKSSAVARFRREARAAGSINSDHVTQVLDVEEDPDHGILLIFELLEGESLIDRLKRTGPIRFEELHPIIEQAWIGLSDAHRAGIIHRDLKPSNVYLEKRPDGSIRVKILDFGVSKLPKEMGGETLTEMGQSLGTFSFMPPEQISKAKTVDHRADIYACTTLIYQALTGHLPYQARNILAMVELKTKTEPRRLSEVMEGPVDPRLEAFLAMGLARDPAQRFQTAAEALAAWRELRPGGPNSQPASYNPASGQPGSSRSAPVSPQALAPAAAPPESAMGGPASPHPRMQAAPAATQGSASASHHALLQAAAPPAAQGSASASHHALLQAAAPPAAQGNASTSHHALLQAAAPPPSAASPPPSAMHSHMQAPASILGPSSVFGPASAMGPQASHHAQIHHAPAAQHTPPASKGTPGQAEPLATTASDLAATVAMPPQVALVQPGRMLGPYGTTLVDQAGRPIAPYTGQPPSSQGPPRVYDESSTGPPSHEVKTQVYRPRGASAVPFPPELPSKLPPPPTQQPSGAKTSALIAVFLVLLAGLAAAAYVNMDYLLEKLG